LKRLEGELENVHGSDYSGIPEILQLARYLPQSGWPCVKQNEKRQPAGCRLDTRNSNTRNSGPAHAGQRSRCTERAGLALPRTAW
jgi:hypothetical protein